MILQRLYDYYNRLDAEGKIPKQGFQMKDLPFVIVLDREGRFVRIRDTRTQVGKKLRATAFLVPAEEGRSGKNAWQVTNLLWDHSGYLLGFNPKDPEKAPKQKATFIKRIEEAFGNPPTDASIQAVWRFLRAGSVESVKNDPLWPELEKIGTTAFMSFEVLGDGILVCQLPVVDAFINQSIGVADETAVFGTCLISGEAQPIARLHPPIKGVMGANTSGASIVAFNLSAFNSYGKTQSYNAQIGEKAAFSYATALNTLLSNVEHRVYMGETTMLFWAQTANPVENALLDFFGASKDDQGEETGYLREILASPHTGSEPVWQDKTPFYVLGLSPNAARISVRFWFEGTAGSVAQNIWRYFDELKIVHGDKDKPFLPVARLLKATALKYEWGNVPPNLAGAMMKAAISGSAYPASLLNAVLRRIRAEQSKKHNDKPVQNVNYARAALIKAILIRNHKKEIPVSLDINRTEPGYLLGRLFAVLEHIQFKAQGGNLNRTIKDRYYGSASATPAKAFQMLIKLSQHHLSKLENKGIKIAQEKSLGEILDKIDRFPVSMNAESQGLFALGYYHQRQNQFNKGETNE